LIWKTCIQAQDKTREQAIDELNEIRRRVVELQAALATAMDAENRLSMADKWGYYKDEK
jgi:post-segregation antitoxin (ccd killing protein)